MKFLPWLRRRLLEDELEDEIKSHLEMAARDHIDRGGLAEKAHADARREFGNIGLVKEATRAAWGLVWLEQLGQDLRYALRVLRRSPGFTAVAVLSLALGIGANTAIFSVVDALVLTALPVRSPDELVLFYESAPDTPSPAPIAVSHQWVESYNDLTDVFSTVTGVCLTERFSVSIDGERSNPDAGPVAVALVSGNYFSTLGLSALIGRTLDPGDDQVPGGHPLTVISYRYWEDRFARAPDVVGRTLNLYGTSYTVIGVAPRGFLGESVGQPTDLWIPSMMQAQVMPEFPSLLARGGSWLRMVGRLKHGVTTEQAEAAAQIVYQRHYYDSWPNPTPEQLGFIARARIKLRPASVGFSQQRESMAQSFKILLIVVGLVLLIACSNLANLLLARSAARHREMAVRLAIGAGRARIIRQLLTESVLLGTLGCAFGLLFSAWGTNAFAAIANSRPVQMDSRNSNALSLDLHPNWRVLAFAGLLGLLTGILFGLAPALRAARASVSPTLDAGRGMGSRGSPGRFGLIQLLVIAQVSTSVILLVGAGLFVSTLRNLKRQDLGIDRQRLLLAWTAPGQTGRQGQALGDFCRTAMDRISALPGVLSVSASNRGLVEGGRDAGGTSDLLIVEARPPKAGLSIMNVVVTPTFFETAGMPLLAGRAFTETDTDTAPPVAIINETLARFLFDGQNMVGTRIGWANRGMQEIVGVVRDGKHGTPRDRRGIVYSPYRQSISAMRTMVFEVRTTGHPVGVSTGVRQQLTEIDGGLPVFKIDSIEEQLNDALAEERLIASVSGFFALLAVLLACLGLYGVIAYTVSRRTGEIGIRMAMGATRAGVLRMVVKESLLICIVGVGIGVPISLASTRLISSRLYGVSPTDPLTIVAATFLMISVAALAAFIPARRASRVDPMVALRWE
jgi:predicted permease